MRPTRWASLRWTSSGALVAAGVAIAAVVVPALAATPTAPSGWDVVDHRTTAITTPTRSAPARTQRTAAPPALPDVSAPRPRAPRAPASSTRRPATVSRPAATTRRPATTTRRATTKPSTARPATTKPATTKPATTKPVTTGPATPATSRPLAPATTSVPASTRADAGRGLTAGWHSGASGPGAADGTLGTLRGSPLQIIGVFADTTAQVQATLPAIATLSGYDGDVDIALGGLTDDTPETWARAAQGAYVNRWTQAARTLRAARGNKPGTVYVRFAHEFNADWFPWKVTSQNVNDFRTSWRLFHNVLAVEFPEAQLVLSANSGSRSDVSIEQMWPGDDAVDVVSVDVHAGWEPADAAGWQQGLDDVTADGSPRGLAAWLAFAARHGKPLAVSRWGLDPGGSATDDGTRVRLMHAFLSANAAVPGRSPAGRVLYDIFFNYPVGTDTRPQITDRRNTASATAYKTLTWGTR